MENKSLILILIVVGLVCVGLGIYIVLKPEANGTHSGPITTQAVPVTSRPSCVVSYPAGSCWTINPPNQRSVRAPSDEEFANSKVTVSGNTCTVIVPASRGDGVRTQGFRIEKGDNFEITASGTVSFSIDHPRVGPEGLNGWYDPYVDSSFNQNVGGLEFSIGSLGSNRYFAGSHYRGVATESGEFVFRSIDRSTGYSDKKFGGFKVVVKRG